MVTFRGMLGEIDRHACSKILSSQVVNGLGICMTKAVVPGVERGSLLAQKGVFDKDAGAVQLEEVSQGETRARCDSSI